MGLSGGPGASWVLVFIRFSLATCGSFCLECEEPRLGPVLTQPGFEGGEEVFWVRFRREEGPVTPSASPLGLPPSPAQDPLATAPTARSQNLSVRTAGA